MNKIRNEVAARGGNSFVLNDALTTAAETTMQADAYECSGQTVDDAKPYHEYQVRRAVEQVTR